MKADDAVEVLSDLPGPLWGALLRAVRRAADRLEPGELPASLRPFARWTPEALAAERPRRAVAEALAADSRLREAVAEALHAPAASQDAVHSDAARLVGTYGEELSVAALAARGRWEDVATVAAQAAQQAASRDRAGAEADLRREAAEAEASRRRLTEELATVRDERDTHRRRADATGQQLTSAVGEQQRLREQMADLNAQVRQLREQLDQQLRRARDRLARQRRRVEEAQARARVDRDRALRVATALEALAAELRAALEPQQVSSEAVTPAAAEGSAVPRDVAVARRGRPCVLPPGLGEDDPLAVRSLLPVGGLEVMVDGYNVSKDPRGQPQAPLADQRRWLLRVAAGAAARYRRRVTVVFDGSEPRPGEVSAPRGVRVVFTAGGQSADERIVELLEDLGSDVPALVVSSDRQVRADCAALGANVTAAASFLAALSA